GSDAHASRLSRGGGTQARMRRRIDRGPPAAEHKLASARFAEGSVRSWQLVLGLVTALPLGCEKPAPPPVLDLSGPVADWPDYGRGKDATAFSPLNQITP